MSFISKLHNFFPTPKYLKKHTAGLSISDNHIRLVAIEETPSGLKLNCYKEEEIPTGSIISGEIQNKENLISILEKIRKEAGFSDVRASMPEEKVYLFETEIPKVLQSEIKSTIEFKIEENVPLKAPDTIFDYVILEEKEDSLRLVISALPKSTVESYEEVIVSAGYCLFAMGIESQSMVNAIVKEDDNSLYLIVHFSLDKIGVYVVKNKLVHFTSTINVLMDIDNSYTKTSLEVLKIANYFNENLNKDSKDQFKKIIVCGSDFDESCLSVLSQTTGIKAELANVWINAFNLKDYIPDISFKDSLRFASAVGAALPYKNIDL